MPPSFTITNPVPHCSSVLSIEPREPHSRFRYWDAFAKQQEQQRQAEEEVHRQQWTAYFAGQAAADGHQVNASQNGEIEEEAPGNAGQSGPDSEGVRVFGSIFYKDKEDKTA
jgi:hypothetical protein